MKHIVKFYVAIVCFKKKALYKEHRGNCFFNDIAMSCFFT